MIVTYKDDVATLDPAIGYDWQNWSMIKSLFDGLMDYEPGTTDARARPRRELQISRRRHDLHLQARPGVKFHNGREMTADDVKYSIDRVINPATQSPGAGFFGSIEGFDDVAGGTATSSAGVTVVDPLDGRVQLSRPDATFLHVMAINFAIVVPKEAVEEFGADFGKHPVGTGAFKLAEWTLGQRLVFERNPDYWKRGRAQARQDHLRDRPGADRGAAAPAEAARSTSSATASRRRSSCEVKDDPEQKAPLIVEGGQLHTGYVTMNVNDAAVRQRRRCARPSTWRSTRTASSASSTTARCRRTSRCRRRCPATPRTTRATPTTPKAPRRCSPRPAIADGFATELYVYEHRPQPAHRPGDPAGSRGDRHQGRDQVAGAGQRHRGRRQRHARR